MWNFFSPLPAILKGGPLCVSSKKNIIQHFTLLLCTKGERRTHSLVHCFEYSDFALFQREFEIRINYRCSIHLRSHWKAKQTVPDYPNDVSILMFMSCYSGYTLMWRDVSKSYQYSDRRSCCAVVLPFYCFAQTSDRTETFNSIQEMLCSNCGRRGYQVMLQRTWPRLQTYRTVYWSQMTAKKKRNCSDVIVR